MCEVLDLRRVLDSKDIDIASMTEKKTTPHSIVERQRDEINKLTLKLTQAKGKLVDLLKQSKSEKERVTVEMEQLNEEDIVVKEKL